MDIQDATNKRKRDVEDTGNQELKKVHVEDRNLGIEDLHLDVGKKYLLCRTRKAPFSQISPAWSACAQAVFGQVFCASSTAVFG